MVLLRGDEDRAGPREREAVPARTRGHGFRDRTEGPAGERASRRGLPVRRPGEGKGNRRTGSKDTQGAEVGKTCGGVNESQRIAQDDRRKKGLGPAPESGNRSD